MRGATAAVIVLSVTSSATAGEFHVTPSGTPSGDGSLGAPWDLTTALAHPAPVQAGDTIWLHGGTYGSGGNMPFVSDLRGTEAAPIIVRQADGERATINGGIQGDGAWTWFWGFEITNAGTQRRVESGVGTANARLSGLNMFGRGLRAINLIVHNTGHPAIGFWNGLGDGAEVYGCIIFGNGIYDPTFPGDGIRGNGTYAQNQGGDRLIGDNISFRNWTEGLDAHSSGSSWVNGFTFEGNAVFDNALGGITTNTKDPANGMQRQRVIDNFLYYRATDNPKTAAQFGYYNDVFNEDLVVRGNVFAMGSADDRAFHVKLWKTATVTDNTIISARYLGWHWTGSPGGEIATWNQNTYYWTAAAPKPFIFGPSSSGVDNGETFLSFAEWQARGYDGASTLTPGRPTGTWIYKRVNKYDAKRAHVIIYNWDLAPTVTLDLSDVLPAGARFELVDAQNYFAAPVVSGRFDGGPVTVSMNLTAVTPILGEFSHWQNRHTAPEFAVFVLRSEAPLVTPPNGDGPAGDGVDGAAPGGCCDARGASGGVWLAAVVVAISQRRRVARRRG